jgi:hypothetical protein
MDSLGGLRPGSAIPVVPMTRRPTENDIGYKIPTLWLDTLNKNAYMLIDVTAGVATWSEAIGTSCNVNLDYQNSVKSIATATSAPPTEVTGDRYIIGPTGTPHANWDGALNNDIVEFDGARWEATTPTEGMMCEVEALNTIYFYIASWQPWQNQATTTTSDVTFASITVGTLEGMVKATAGLLCEASSVTDYQLPLGYTAEDSANKSTSIATDAVSTVKYPSVKIIKDYADGLVAGLLDLRGAYDASGNTWPTTGGSGTAGAILKGDAWYMSVPGTLGGVALQVGDSFFALVDTPGQTAGNWNTLNTNIGYVPEDPTNKVTSISGASTDTQYPSAKLVYDSLPNNEVVINTLAKLESYYNAGSGKIELPAGYVYRFGATSQITTTYEVVVGDGASFDYFKLSAPKITFLGSAGIITANIAITATDAQRTASYGGGAAFNYAGTVAEKTIRFEKLNISATSSTLFNFTATQTYNVDIGKLALIGTGNNPGQINNCSVKIATVIGRNLGAITSGFVFNDNRGISIGELYLPNGASAPTNLISVGGTTQTEDININIASLNNTGAGIYAYNFPTTTTFSKEVKVTNGSITDKTKAFASGSNIQRSPGFVFSDVQNIPNTIQTSPPGIDVATPISAADISIDHTNRILTITPPLGYFHFYVGAPGAVAKYTKTAPVNFPVFPDTSGIYTFYFDSAGLPQYGTGDFLDFNVIAPVYRILWNSTKTPDSAKVIALVIETHLNDIPAILHTTQHQGGAIWKSGGVLVVTPTTGTPDASGVNTCIGLTTLTNIDDNLLYTVENSTGGGLWQQDLGDTTPANITVSNGALLDIMYPDATGHNRLPATRFPFDWNSSTNIPQYITAAGARTPVSNGYYFVQFIVSIQDPRTGKTVVSFSSGAEYTTPTDADAVTWSSMQALFPLTADKEIRPLYKEIRLYRTIFPAAVKYTSLYKTVDLRVSPVIQTSATGSLPATSVTSVPAGTLASTNVQSALNELGTEKAPIDNPSFTTKIYSPIVLAGTTATSTDWPTAKVVGSQADSGHSYTGNIGVVGESVAAAADTGTGVGGVSVTNGANDARGVVGVGKVGNTADTGKAVAVYGYVNGTHAGGDNVGLRGSAINGANNYALLMDAGNIKSVLAQSWELLDNSTSALSLGSTGKADILKIITTDGSEGVSFSGNVVIGDTAPFSTSQPLTLKSTTGGQDLMLFNSTPSNALNLRFIRSNSDTKGTIATTTTGTILGDIDAFGADAKDIPTYRQGGLIRFKQNGAAGGSGVTGGYVPTDISLWTSPGGTTSAQERLIITKDGNFLTGGLPAAGTNAVKVHAWGSGTAPTAVIADGIQMWSADFLGTAGDARLHVMGETNANGKTVIGSGKETITGTTGGFTRGFSEATVSITAAATCTIQVNIPATSRIIGCQLRVDTELTAGELWDATYSGGSTDAICTGQAVAKNTKVNSLTSAVVTAETDIAITKTGGGSFTAAGVIRAVVYYEYFETMANAV